MLVPTSKGQIILEKMLAASEEASRKRFNVLIVTEPKVAHSKVVGLDPQADIYAKCTGSLRTCIKTGLRVWFLAQFCDEDMSTRTPQTRID